ncbi:DUF3800 domain-containing protein [Methylobacterium bullatum]|uniref:DUF3800 domain-containing protein n=1 Tax=Methylobacterium bullatum TaxID=570505 RepID=UPI0030D3F5E9
MSNLITIYCDESCHLEHDRIPPMVLGCIWTPKSEVKRLSNNLRDIKRKHNANGELKWTKVSKSRIEFYKEVVDWFFSESSLRFRSFIVPNKADLDHNRFNEGSHDLFYYKSYFNLISKILYPPNCYSIYLDIKDTRSKFRVSKLREILLNDQFDFTGSMIERVQHIRSHESEMMQLADLFIGAVGYRHRRLSSNVAKASIVAMIEDRIDKKLTQSTALEEQKFNMFVWRHRQ